MYLVVLRPSKFDDLAAFLQLRPDRMHTAEEMQGM